MDSKWMTKLKTSNQRPSVQLDGLNQNALIIFYISCIHDMMALWPLGPMLELSTQQQIWHFQINCDFKIL